MVSFVDEARIKVQAGNGGNGVTAWHHEPYKPKGGPDGGNGGHGGSVVLRADASVGTLAEVARHPHVRAEPGGHGRGKRLDGARGRDRVVLVPPGTVVFDEEGVLIADLAKAGEELVAARGGRGGFGNAHWATATHRAPEYSEKGEPGEQRSLRLELRLLADVALVGFPNAGKSTLIARISSAKPKIASYPFTTLTPNLGVVRTSETSFVVADIPGLVEGAHRGKGLGHQFLRHIRRASILVFLVDLAAEGRDSVDDVAALRAELEAFDPELAARPAIVVASKVDVGRERLRAVRRLYPDAVAISAVTGEGIDALVTTLGAEVEKVRAESPAPAGYIRHVTRDEPIEVLREDTAWRVTGRLPERVVAMTDMDNQEAVARLQRRLISMGVERKLDEAGARAGEEVRIGDVAFEFEPEGDQGGVRGATRT